MTNIQNIQNPDSKFTNLNSTLNDLPKADQDRILNMLDHRSYRDVLEEINQPAPEGLGLKIHSNSLRKFYLKHLPTRLAEERPGTAADWKLLAEQAARDPIDFQDLIRESLEREVYLAFLHSEPTNPRPIKLLQCLLRWRGQDLAKAKRSGKSTKSPAIAKLFGLGGSPTPQPTPGDGFPGLSGVPTPPASGAPPGFATPNPAILNMLKSMLDTARSQAAAQPEDGPSTSTSDVKEPITSAQPALAADQVPSVTGGGDLKAASASLEANVVNSEDSSATLEEPNQSEPVRTSMNNVEQHKTTHSFVMNNLPANELAMDESNPDSSVRPTSSHSE